MVSRINVRHRNRLHIEMFLTLNRPKLAFELVSWLDLSLVDIGDEGRK